MKLSELKSLISDIIIEANKKPAPKKGSVTPKSVDEFRKMLANAMKVAGAPVELTQEVGDVGVDGVISHAVWSAWNNSVDDMNDFDDGILPIVHDCVIDVCDEYLNPMNYAPGHKPKKFDVADLAQRTLDVMSGYKVAGKLKGEPTSSDIARALVSELKKVFKGTKFVVKTPQGLVSSSSIIVSNIRDTGRFLKVLHNKSFAVLESFDVDEITTTPGIDYVSNTETNDSMTIWGELFKYEKEASIEYALKSGKLIEIYINVD